MTMTTSSTTDASPAMMTKAPFSFHCIICIEPFRPHDRPPVVLPCGHTYVCLPCSKRLKRCMECRTPLYMTPHSSSLSSRNLHHDPHAQPNEPLSSMTAADDLSSRGRSSAPHAVPHLTAQQRALQARYGTQFSPPRVGGGNVGSSVGGAGGVFREPPPKREEPVPLPLPKNLVLLGLMEVADRQSSAADDRVMQDDDDEDDENDVGGDLEDEDDEYESGDDDERVFRGMRTLTGPCGTYAVRCEGGLEVLASHPNGSNDNSSSDEGESEETNEANNGRAMERKHAAVLEWGGDRNNKKNTIENSPGKLNKKKKKIWPRRRGSGNGNGNGSTAKGRNKKESYDLQQEKENERDSREYSDSSDDDCYEHEEGEEDVSSPAAPTTPRMLPTGTTVQVVSVDADVGGDHVYELARHEGYIVASSTQLVKVGAPQDKACQIEGMIKSAASEKRELQKKLDEMTKLEAGLKKDFDRALRKGDVPSAIALPPPPPVASSPTAGSLDVQEDENIIEVSCEVDGSHHHHRGGGGGKGGGGERGDELFDRIPSPPTIRIVSGVNNLAAPATPQDVRDPSHGAADDERSPQTPHTVDNSDIYQPPADELGVSHHSSVELSQPLMSINCSNMFGSRYSADVDDDSLVGLSFDSAGLGNAGDVEATIQVQRDPPPPVPPPARSPQRSSSARNVTSGGGSWWTPERPTPPPVTSSPSYESVNFRTGLSGHRALTSSRTRPDHHLNAYIARGETRMMGEHKGISHIHRLRGTTRTSASGSMSGRSVGVGGGGLTGSPGGGSGGGGRPPSPHTVSGGSVGGGSGQYHPHDSIQPSRSIPMPTVNIGFRNLSRMIRPNGTARSVGDAATGEG